MHNHNLKAKYRDTINFSANYSTYSNNAIKRVIAMVTITFLVAACTGIPKGVDPIDDFQVDRYLGTWYEIARLDHSFERGLSNVTAEYSLKKDGGITVLNKGFSKEKQEWKTAEGKAYFVGNKDTGHLKVSFFGPFYSSYIIFKLDKTGYQYAYIAGYNTDYLWLLARTPTVSEEVKNDFKKTSSSLGFNTGELIFVDQSSASSPAK